MSSVIKSVGFLVLCGLTLNPLAALAATSCPAVSGQKLASIEIYDGKPELIESLVPDQHFPTSDTAFDGWNYWKLGYVGNPDGFYLQCRYDNKKAVQISLPKKTAGCREDFKQNGIVVLCK